MGVLPVEEKRVITAQMEELRKQALENPEQFWDEKARALEWFKIWEKVLDDSQKPFFRWFVGGLINASYNCLDKHVKTWRKNKVAIIWEGEGGEIRKYTYRDLFVEVNRVASLLRNFGIREGDRIALYLPMIPELPIFMLAAARIGAIHTVVFSGFSSDSLAKRINDSKARLLVTADGGFRRGKIVPLKEIADKALEQTFSVENVIVVKRAGNPVNMVEGRDFWLHTLLEGVSKNTYIEPVKVDSNHPLFILYTSGTTGSPKGIYHSTGGYLVWVYWTFKWAFNLNDEDIWWCTADIGWITGHSYVVYGPLMHGLTTLMYEGALDYPAPDRVWSIIEKHGVTGFYTSPTAIRMFMRYGKNWVELHDLSSLRILGSVGEPINPEAWEWYFNIVGKGKCPIIDTWWQTETGGFMISPAAGIQLLPLKPGSATIPLPGVEADVYTEDGEPAPPGTQGYLVIKKPWPGMLLGVWGDPKRYIETYWSRFPNCYYPGDYAMRDEDGYFWILGRADEVLKVAAHRIGTMEIESALVSHPAVAEAAVIGKPDPIKGEVPVAFVVLREGYVPSLKLEEELLNLVSETIGPIAKPANIFFVHKLPKTRSGKIMRRVLKAIVKGEESLGDLSTIEDASAIEELKSLVGV
ncbi:3-hydroxypropionyl-CoA synthetase [Infirmifilum uzonense]|uniref:Acetate--CoA ligase n=1 Tax=Infirmifilum uzonense TaxID=1550241 RepID=A0A0F7FHP0_9CREN|nr:acetate--CoA ligase [Infirmifilum uzonense]AKG38827.1 3-hydroxypropionyl-CoA synthetase [Infirmifilum uzonense]